MRQLDLVWQARVYVNQARRTISAAQKTRLLAMAQRLLAINAKDADRLTLVNTLVLPLCFSRQRGRRPAPPATRSLARRARCGRGKAAETRFRREARGCG
jgi:hypothetical protein